jgi:hypothetical protein
MAAGEDAARAGDVYGPLLAEQLTRELTYKTSIEQRGLGVITTSGVLVSLVVALAALALGDDSDRYFTGAPTALLIAAVASFVSAAALGLVVNAPGRYRGLGPTDLDRIAAQRTWDADNREAAFIVGQQRAEELKAAMAANERKSTVLLRAIAAEIIGVVLMASAVVVAVLR